MKFEDLLNGFVNKYKDIIVNYELIQEGAKGKHRTKKVYAFWIKPNVSSDKVLYQVVSFWVFNEGKSNEKAFFEGGEPNWNFSNTKNESFIDKLNEYLGKLVSKGVILGGIVEMFDENLETSVVRVYMQGVGGVSEKRFFVRRVNGKWEYHLIKE